MTVKLELVGDRELRAMLKHLPEKVQTRVMKSAVRYAGRRIRKFQRDGVQPHNQTKTLHRSIGTKLKTYRSGNTVLIVGPRKGPKYMNPTNNERADKYAVGIERGWRGRTPDPFMRRSYLMGRATVVGDFVQGIGNGIEREAQKLAKKA